MGFLEHYVLPVFEFDYDDSFLMKVNASITTLGDGTRIVHRIITSTKGSPAVEITISGSSQVKNQKIHFVLKED